MVTAVAVLALFSGVASALAPGDFDPTFATNGIFNTPLGEGARPGAVIFAVAIQPDGRIVLAGSASNSQVVVARLTASGALDPSFGTGGRFLTSLGAGANESTFLYGVAIQQDGAIVVAGSRASTLTNESRMLVARVNADGSGLDSGFGSNGILVRQLGKTYTTISSLALDSAGRALVAGGANDGAGVGKTLVARVTAGGELDTTFADSGASLQLLGTGAVPGSSAAAMQLQQNGQVVTVGSATDTDAAQADAAGIERLTADGKSLDPSFGIPGSAAYPGKILTRFGEVAPMIMTPTSLALQPDAKIVVGGFAVDGSSKHMFFVARLNADGNGLDPSFGTGGRVLQQPANGFSELTAIAVQPDGKIVGAGASASAQTLITRLNADGTFDQSFGSGGVIVTKIGPVTSDFKALALDPQGLAVAAGETVDGVPDVHALAARYVLQLPPSAAFTATPSAVVVGHAVAFADSGSSDPDGTIAAYGWDFGDGATASGAIASHAYAAPGSYTAKLTVRDNYGATASSTGVVTVSAAPGAAAGARAVVSRLEISPRAFAAAASGASIAKRAGAAVSYRDSQAAITTFTVLRARPGRRTAHRCGVVTKANKKRKRCTRYVKAAGSFTHNDRAGANSFRFTGRLSGHKLAPGAYRLVSTPRIGAQTGTSATAGFQIARPRHHR